MAGPVVPLAAALVWPAQQPSPGPVGLKFKEFLQLEPPPVAKPEPVSQFIITVLREVEVDERRLDQLTKLATSGRPFSNAELLGLQASMYKYALEVELLSKLIQEVVSGFKELLKTQV